MQIICDENIPYAREAFGPLGELRLMPGRAITRSTLDEAEVLLVRSITRVHAELLEGTPVRFVGTATAGEDHIDQAYLRTRQIRYASAPGSNANSVAEYVVAALMVLSQRFDLHLPDLKLGIVGVGNVGRLVLKKARALGMACVLNDPPLAGATCEAIYRSIEEIHTCDIITLHVPLEMRGPYPTHHLVDARFLKSLRPQSILINTSRGAVVDNPALLRALEEGAVRAAVLDVWEHEPDINLPLLEQCAVATPHIAGYSFDAKVNGTIHIYRALCRAFQVTPEWDVRPLLPAPETPKICVNTSNPRAIHEAVFQVYDILADDERMRSLARLPEHERATGFDRLRKQYPRRREFSNTTATLNAPDESLRQTLAGLGFTI